MIDKGGLAGAEVAQQHHAAVDDGSFERGKAAHLGLHLFVAGRLDEQRFHAGFRALVWLSLPINGFTAQGAFHLFGAHFCPRVKRDVNAR